jgi:hypothetical protein
MLPHSKVHWLTFNPKSHLDTRFFERLIFSNSWHCWHLQNREWYIHIKFSSKFPAGVGSPKLSGKFKLEKDWVLQHLGFFGVPGPGDIYSDKAYPATQNRHQSATRSHACGATTPVRYAGFTRATKTAGSASRTLTFRPKRQKST